MSAGSLKPIVDRTGSESSEYQFIREAYQNAVEARATEFRIRWEQGASRIGVYRFEAADDGVSMTRQELPAFVNKFGGGGKPIGGAHENFGVGLKSSTLPWNHHGILVIARRGDETNLIQLHLDDSAGEFGEYGLRQWNLVNDETGEEDLVDVLTIALKEDGKWVPVLDRDYEVVEGTRVRDLLDAFLSDDQGTVIVLCGNTGKEDTFLAIGSGGVMGQGGHTEIATYISRRYDTLPIPVSVIEPKSGDKHNWPRTPDEFAATHINKAGNANYKVKTRNALGVGDFLREGTERGKKKPLLAGTFELEDRTKVHWFLLPEGERYDGKGVGGVYWTPQICVKYKGEVYYPGGASQQQRFRDFGISRRAVIERCTLMLEPPINNGGPGVYPDSSRSRLLWTGGNHLPWSRWARETSNKLPTPIEDALAKATAELGQIDDTEDLSETQKKRLDALTRRIQSSWRRKARPSDSATRVQIVRVRKAGTGEFVAAGGSDGDVGVGGSGGNGGGDGGGGSGGGGGGGSGGGGTSGGRHGKARQTGQGEGAGSQDRYVEDPSGTALPTVVVGRPDQIPEVEWLPAAEFDEPNMIGRWDEAGFRIQANLNCPIIRETVDYWTNQHPRVDADAIMRAVKRVYALKLRSAVAHMLTAKKRGTITQDQLDGALTPVALTIAAAGFVLEDVALAGDIGALAGKSRPKAITSTAP
jgi:uncharacterized membrane protein YgcG